MSRHRRGPLKRSLEACFSYKRAPSQPLESVRSRLSQKGLRPEPCVSHQRAGQLGELSLNVGAQIKAKRERKRS